MWGSDAVAEEIAAHGFGFVAFNPGASWRGLHDSLVNHLPDPPELLLCLHEEHAVAAAHGWSKVTGRPSLAIVHSNVGLLHASMAIYNAWVDRAPVVVLGATGPMAADRRRPWIEWIHTSQDQGAVVRPFTKWDDHPVTPAAAVSALRQAVAVAAMAPCGPVYVCLDVAAQETELDAGWQPLPPPPPASPPAVGREAVAWLAAQAARAERPVLMPGRLSRDAAGWEARQRLADRIGAVVVHDIRTAGAFPFPDPRAVGAPGFGPDAAQKAALAAADLVIALDWIDLAGALAGVPHADGMLRVAVGVEPLARRGWVKDGFGPPPVDRELVGCPDRAVADLLGALGAGARPVWTPPAPAGDAPAPQSLGAAAYGPLADALDALGGRVPLTITRLPLGWPAGRLRMSGPLDYIGRDGGEGLGSGPGMAVGAALALRGTGRLAVAVVGDGDLMMGATALWTAAAHRLSLVVVVAANGVYGNDVVHQATVARLRGRPVERRWIGQRLDDPRIDIAALARAQGFGFARRVAADEAPGLTLEAAAAHALAEGPALVELEVPSGAPPPGR